MTPPVAAHAPARPRLVRSLIGKKVIMAITGVILLLFVIAHLLGNLKVFQGAEHFNAYAEGLRTLGAPFFPRGSLLWVARVVLLVAVGAHISDPRGKDRKSTRLNSSHLVISYAVFCLKKK